MLKEVKSPKTGKYLDFRKYCLIIFSLVFVSINIHAQNGWTKKANLPTPSSGASASVFDNKIYVIGGYNQNGDLTVNEVYEPITNTWETKQPMPTKRGYLLTCVLNDTIYAMGGGQVAATNKNEAYNPVTNLWTTKADLPYTWTGVYGDTIGGIIYIIGGNYDRQSCFAYDPGTNTWKEKKSIPLGGCKGTLSATAYNGLIYTFGGVTNYPDGAMSTVNVYNPKTDTWDTTKTDMPTSRYALRTFLINGKIYAIGGSQRWGSALSTVEVYDPVTDTWESKPNIPFKVSWFTGAVYNDKIYVFGGTTDWMSVKNEVWEYDPAFHTDVAAGNLSGRWTLANSPYHINGEITIPNDSTLRIEPGVEVVFMGHYKLNVQGRLLAIGTKNDPILFTAEDKETGWHGIRFTNTSASNDTSRVIYCSFKYGNANTGTGFDRCGGAMLIKDFDKVYVSNCIFDSNKQQGDGWDPPESTGGIYIYHASPIITKNTFSNNYSASKSSAVACVNCPNAIVSNNTFVNNKGVYSALAFVSSSRGIISGNIISNNIATDAGGGILIDCALVSGTTSPLVENNIIIHNQGLGGGGICCYINANPILINNTIAFNSADGGGAIYCDGNSDPIFINNILFGNTAAYGNQVYINDTQSDPIFEFNDIQEGKEGFAGSGAGINYSGLYKNNINADPSFANVKNDAYYLTNVSPCIGAGIDSVEINGTMYQCPPFCLLGHPRPSPAGSMPDIGAYESFLGTFVDVEEELTTPKEFALYQNYPNPFNPNTTLSFVIGHSSLVTLKIYDVLGREIAALVNEEKPEGTYKATWNAVTLPSGVYFYQLKAGSYTATKKLLLLK